MRTQTHEQGKGRVDVKADPGVMLLLARVTPKTASQPECQKQTSSRPPKEAPADTLNPMSTLPEPADNKPLVVEPPNVNFAGTLEN